MKDNMIPIQDSEIYEEIDKEVINYLGDDINNIFYFPYRTIIPFAYFDDFLWFSIVLLEQPYLQNLRLKELIQQKKEEVQKLLKENDYKTLFSLTEKSIKIDMLIKYFHEVPDDQKYDIFQEVYISSEYSFNLLQKDFLEKVFSYRQLSNEWNQRRILIREKADTEGYLTIYRGEGTKSTHIEKALSWTLSRETAQFFATRFDHEGILWKARIPCEEVIDYLNHRKEEEVLVDFIHLKNVTLYSISK